MRQRPMTLHLDEDIVEALEAMDAPSVSAAANAALREMMPLGADHHEADRAAMLRWLDELDAKYGMATPEQETAVQAVFDELDGRSPERPDSQVG